MLVANRDSKENIPDLRNSQDDEKLKKNIYIYIYQNGQNKVEFLEK
jgi:hypothetical protein